MPCSWGDAEVAADRELSVPEPESGERLHVRIARSGLCSRRTAERLIAEGRVSVNDSPITEQGFKVDESDEVRVDGNLIRVPSRHYTVALNKPKGILTTLSDPQNRPTIVPLLPDYGVPLKPVGRLDRDTEGLLLCTSDGEFANRLAHPRYEIDKEYHAIVEGVPDVRALERLRKGVYIEGGKTHPAQVSVIHADAKSQSTSLKIVIHEGRKRQIRLMLEAVGHPVRELRRVRIGPLSVKGMRPGECRLVGESELALLRKAVGLDR